MVDICIMIGHDKMLKLMQMLTTHSFTHTDTQKYIQTEKT